MARVKVEEEIILPEKKTGGLYFGTPKTDISFIPSGCKMLDLALGGGWARRRIANIVGDSSTGKTLLAIESSANFTIIEPKAKIRYREAEEAFDNNYAAALGFPLDKVDFGDPLETIEDMFEDLQKVAEGAKGPELYIVDSLDALSDRAEMGRDIDQGSYGSQKAKKLSELFRRTTSLLANKDITVIIISQVRDNIGAMPFQKKHIRSGGKALNFYSSQVAWLSQIKKLDRTVSNIKRITGVQVKAVIEKNKIGLPYREAEFPIMFGFGIDDFKSCSEFWKTVTGEIVPKTTSLQDLHRMVSDEWWAIENKFLPQTSKYGK
jgi:recombination protein RecA